MDKEQALGIVKKYKEAISHLFDTADVYLYGSYSKGTAHQESDIDVAVIVPQLEGDWLKLSTRLWVIAPKIDLHIEPVLMEKNEPSPLYDDVMRTGIAV